MGTKFEDLSKQQEQKVKDLENKLELFEKHIDKVKEIEEKQTSLIEEAKTRYRCNQCEFSTYYQKGLQVHKSYSCENCENIFETKRELKIHMYTHSFTDTHSKQICENCDFESNIIETMEVHIGKCRTKDFECGLCEAKFVELESLEVRYT